MFLQSQTFVLGLECLRAWSRVHLDQLTRVKAITCLLYAAGVLLLPFIRLVQGWDSAGYYLSWLTCYF